MPFVLPATDNHASLIDSALQHGIYGFAVWDEDLNLITANPQYADLHMIPNTLFKPGTNLRTIVRNLKDRGVLMEKTDPDTLVNHIKETLAKTGHLTSFIRFANDTVLEISAERMPNGCIAVHLRNASREKMKAKEWQSREKKLEAYADAISRFPESHTETNAETLSDEIDLITKTVATLLGVDWCMVWTQSETLGEATATSAYQRAVNNHVAIDNMALPDLAEFLQILATSQVVAVDDIDKHAFGRVRGTRAPLGEQSRASMDAPFRKDGMIIGVLTCVNTQQTRTWDPEDRMLIMSAASHIGGLMSAAHDSDSRDLPAGEVYGARQAAE